MGPGADPASLMPHLVEESYEVLDASARWPHSVATARVRQTRRGLDGREDAYVHLQEELGDLLFQIVFHARLAEEDGAFDLADVARGVHDKLVHRHPHVFGDVDGRRAGPGVANWEDIKKSEKGRRSVTEGIPAALPALMLTTKLARKARSVGLDPAPVMGAAVAADLASLVVRAARERPAPRRPVVE